MKPPFKPGKLDKEKVKGSIENMKRQTKPQVAFRRTSWPWGYEPDDDGLNDLNDMFRDPDEGDR